MLQKLREGNVSLVKFGRRGGPHKRTFTLTPDMHLSWESSWKPKARTQVDLSRVDRVQTGQRTRKFSRFAEKHRSVNGHSLSLIYDDQLSSLDLVAESEEEANTLVGLLNRLVVQCQDERTMEDEELKNFRQQWRKADKDNSGTLDKKEIVRLVQKLNITASSSYIKQKMREVDFNGDGVLQFKEFVFLMRFLGERPEVEALFLTLLQASHESNPSRFLARCLREDRAAYPPTEAEKLRLRQETMPLSTFALFLREVQGEDVTDERVAELVASVTPHGSEAAMSYRAFFNYIGSVNENAPVDPKTLTDVYQDMNQPLSHYYIASSHNTYLEGDQLQSNSSVNRYINDLCKGCRCVELDCWDGDDGEPLIYHGYTLTGRIRFADVIQAVKDYAFEKTDFPVILSLENHCSLPQQQKMAQCMKDVLGDKMAVLPELGEGDPLPSPESLRGKIVIKGKVVREGEEYAELDEEEDEEEQQNQALEASKSGKMLHRRGILRGSGAGTAAENDAAYDALPRAAEEGGGSHSRKGSKDKNRGRGRAPPPSPPITKHAPPSRPRRRFWHRVPRCLRAGSGVDEERHRRIELAGPRRRGRENDGGAYNLVLGVGAGLVEFEASGRGSKQVTIARSAKFKVSAGWGRGTARSAKAAWTLDIVRVVIKSGGCRDFRSGFREEVDNNEVRPPETRLIVKPVVIGEICFLRTPVSTDRKKKVHTPSPATVLRLGSGGRHAVWHFIMSLFVLLL
ncbi:unnamed protein product [Scytosiphon promiscuus]